jgi:hypothetical protein
MNTSLFDHKFELNETVYFKTPQGVNKGLVVEIYFQKNLSINNGQNYKYLSYGILKNTQEYKVLEHNVFATTEEAFK